MTSPFIYISGLMRTGSTVLAEALTSWPYSFILREPDLGKNAFAIRPGDAEFLMQKDIDLTAFGQSNSRSAFLQRRLRRLGYPQDYMVRRFKADLLTQLHEQVAQVGVKEVHNAGWRNYLKHFPDMRVVIIARDPRDIYISNYHRFQRGLLKHKSSHTPIEIANELSRGFAMQLQLRESTNAFPVRYEDLCLQPQLFAEIKRFVDSPIPTMGEVGQFTGKHPDRSYEQQLHGNHISAQSVSRWRKEQDASLLADAQSCFDQMPEYTAFWNYPK
jgi:hypothetical protein